MDIMNTVEAAQYIRLAKPTLEKLRLTGNGPVFLKLGRSVRYTRQALDNWVASRTATSTSQQRAA